MLRPRHRAVCLLARPAALMASWSDRWLSSEAWVAQRVGGDPEGGCRMPLPKHPRVADWLQVKTGASRKTAPKLGQDESPIKPLYIGFPGSHLPSDSAAGSGLGAKHHGEGQRSPLAETVQGTDPRHRESDYLHGGPGA